MGVVPDEKLLELLELSMSSDTAETVKRARDLMDSGVDPMVLMSQLASLIMDIIAGTYNVADAKYNTSFFGGRSCEFQPLKCYTIGWNFQQLRNFFFSNEIYACCWKTPSHIGLHKLSGIS